MHFDQIRDVFFEAGEPSKVVLKRMLKRAVSDLYVSLRDNKVDFTSVKRVFFRLDASVEWLNLQNTVLEVCESLSKLAQSRFPDARIHVLFCSDFEHQIFLMNGTRPHDVAGLLDEVRNDELTKVFEASDALYEGNRHHYFRLPSEKTSDFFVRVGNCLADQAALNSFGFWAIPALKDCSVIICDTWSISTLGMYLARILERRSGNRVDCQYLSNYLSQPGGALSNLNTIFDRLGDANQTPVFLVSALSSGRIIDDYRLAFERLFSGQPARVLALFKVSTDELPTSSKVGILCDIAPALSAKGLLGFCDEGNLPEGNRVFTVDAKTYFPKYFEPKVHKFVPSKYTKSSKAFFEMYGGLGVFSVCRDGKTNKKLNMNRHHAFHVDVRELFKTAVFKERISRKLADVSLKPTHIVHLNKAADRFLAQTIADHWQANERPKRLEMSKFINISNEDAVLDVLNNASHRIWFIDAMFISGSGAAQDFEQGLRKGLGVLEIPEYPSDLSYFIGLLRPDSRSKITSDVEKMLKWSCPTRSKKIDVMRVEEVLLPNWDQRFCPWCRERKRHAVLLERFGQAGMTGFERRYIEDRISSLSGAANFGLKEGLFFKRYPSHEFSFNGLSLWFDTTVPKSHGLEHSEADVMLAVASAVQEWRDSYNSLPPAQYLMDQQTSFGVNVYNETFLRAAVWRSLKANEIDVYYSDIYKHDLLVRAFDRGDQDDGDEFVLGWEAANLLGGYLQRVLGVEKFEAIDWEYLKRTASPD